MLLLHNLRLKVTGLILSKSKIQMCEDRGQSAAKEGIAGASDPHNVVDGKACKKKMVVLMSVKNGQKEGTEKLMATVSRVRDETEGEFAKMYNPFVILLSMSAITINYPFIYTGHTVNNEPWEEIILGKSSWWKAISRYTCYDAWQERDGANHRPTCGYVYNEKKKRIPNSQGFCCTCSLADKLDYTLSEARQRQRGGVACQFLTNNPQSSAHCMRHDDLWYSIHYFRPSYKDFTIHIRAKDQETTVENNKTVVKWVNGGEIVLSPRRKAGVGKNGRIIGHYVGTFQTNTALPVLQSFYLLVPFLSKKATTGPTDHDQMKHGASRYLVMPRDMVDVQNGMCNKIGVGFRSFRVQASSGQGPGCHQLKGDCLRNQPKHYFDEDVARVDRGERPFWFPAQHGKFVGAKTHKETDKSVFAYELEETVNSIVSLEISADDVIYIYSRSTGEIVRAQADNFEASSGNGKMSVIIRNTGHVTAEFTVTVEKCTKGLHMIGERSLSIYAQKTSPVGFSLMTTGFKGGAFVCEVTLFDARRAKLAGRNITFNTSSPCMCEQTTCRCVCDEGGGVKCITKEGKFWVNPKQHQTVNTNNWWSKTFGWFGGIFKKIGSFFGGIFSSIFGIFGLAKYIIPIIVLAIGACVFFNCGGPLICKGFLKAAPIGKVTKLLPSFGSKKSKKKNKKKEKKEEKESDDDDDDDDDSDPPSYDEAVENKKKSKAKTTIKKKATKAGKSVKGRIQGRL